MENKDVDFRPQPPWSHLCQGQSGISQALTATLQILTRQMLFVESFQGDNKHFGHLSREQLCGVDGRVLPILAVLQRLQSPILQVL